jgi:hypothetical protein
MLDTHDSFTIEDLVPDFVPPALPTNFSAPAIEAADRSSRYWRSDYSGKLRPGSEAHKLAVCRMFRETFNPYRPSVIEWPKLPADALERLTSLPIWDIAVQTEGKARLRMASYARQVCDPEMKAAIALNSWEENRHKEVLSTLVRTYGIQLANEPPYQQPRNAEWAYMVTGYSECIDSFFAFGLFESARRSRFFPEELVQTFEPVMQDECRHILLFANWVAWYRAQLPWYRRIYFELKVAAVWVFLGWERLGIARGLGAAGKKKRDNSNFPMSSSKAVAGDDVNVPDLMALCLEENDRRFAGYDARLLRPTTMPRLVRFALRFMRRDRDR